VLLWLLLLALCSLSSRILMNPLKPMGPRLRNGLKDFLLGGLNSLKEPAKELTGLQAVLGTTSGTDSGFERLKPLPKDVIKKGLFGRRKRANRKGGERHVDRITFDPQIMGGRACIGALE